MSQRPGFSIVEILVVLAVMGLLMGIAWVNLHNLRERTVVRQGATSYAVVLKQARTLAQRYSSDVTVALTPAGFSLTQMRSGQTVVQNYTLPTGVEALAAESGGATTVVYQPPYGEVAPTGVSISFRSKRNNSIAVVVGAVGLTGKVVQY